VERTRNDETPQPRCVRVRDLTVDGKLSLIDDVFASAGSANSFSRSMVDADSWPAR
jgi:phosphatidylserine/phosphatidylglycerophosphate/cardiolipin synthase-like enzyme